MRATYKYHSILYHRVTFFLKKNHKNPSANCILQPCSFLVKHLNIQVCVLNKQLHNLAALCKTNNFNDTIFKTKEKTFYIVVNCFPLSLKIFMDYIKPENILISLSKICLTLYIKSNQPDSVLWVFFILCLI